MKLRTCQERQPGRLLRVVVADDSAPVRQLLGRLFAGLPQFEVVGEAADGCQALAAITALRPDVVILDIRMPGMTGLEVLQNLGKQTASCKIIVFSQSGDPAYRNKCAKLGAHAFFDKVADFDAFQRTLRQMSAPDPARKT